MKTVTDRINHRFSDDDLKKFNEILSIISAELMPEVVLGTE